MINANPTVLFTKPCEVAVENLPIPSPESGELLIKTRCTLISIGTETTILGGRFPEGSLWHKYAEYPWHAGYDNIGEIVEVGPDVDNALIGKRVATYGPHAQYFTWEASAAYPVPPDASDEEAVFFTIAEIVLNGIRRSGLKLGESVGIYGMGLLGQLTARFCRLWGAWPVIGIDLSDSRLARLPKDKGIVSVNPKTDDLSAVVDKATKGRMVDIVFELTGEPSVIPQEFAILRPHGKLVVLSSPRGITSFDFNDCCSMLSYTIIGSHNFSHPEHATIDNPWTRARDVELYFDFLVGEQIDMRPLISHRHTVDQAPDVYRKLLEDKTEAMGILFDWTGGS